MLLMVSQQNRKENRERTEYPAVRRDMGLPRHQNGRAGRQFRDRVEQV